MGIFTNIIKGVNLVNNDERMLGAIISNYREENGIRRDKLAFDYFTVSQILKNYELDFDDIDECIVDGGGDGAIDIIGIFLDKKLIHTLEEIEDLKSDIDSKSELDIYIIQNKDKNSFNESVFEKLIPTFRDMFNYDLDKKELQKTYNQSVLEKILMVREILDAVMLKSNNVNLYVYYACKGSKKNVSKGVIHKKDILKEIIKELISIPNITLDILGASELRNLYVDRQEDELILKYESQMAYETEKGNSRGYIATVNLKNYFDFVTKEKRIRESILESNIRHYQGNVTVNRGILDTLRDDKDLEFWWLNNGVTILVSEIVPLPNNKLKLKDPQIVNGLQTTFCIVDYIKNNYEEDESRTVLLKIIKTNESKNIDKIISSTNSQTEVRAADLRATEEIQRDIEQYFLSRGYYYDRRKNYYKNLKKDRNKIFTIAKTAQYVETILFRRPHAARSNPTTLLKSDESYTRIFNKKINIEVYLKVCMIFKVVDSFIKEIDKESDPIYQKYGVSIKHFTFHIMLISSLLVVSKRQISDNELAEINIESMDDSLISKAITLLLNSLDELVEKNPTENLISLAKLKTLTDNILKNI